MIPVPIKIPKKKVKNAVDKIHDVLIKEFGNNTLLHAFTIKMIYSALKDQEAIEKIMLPNDLTGKDVLEIDKRINRCRQIIEGMSNSTVNIILFRNDEDVWMQYHMGLFLQRDTLIFALEKDKHEIIPRIKIGDLVKDIVYVKCFNSEESRNLIVKTLNKYVKKK